MRIHVTLPYLGMQIEHTFDWEGFDIEDNHISGGTLYLVMPTERTAIRPSQLPLSTWMAMKRGAVIQYWEQEAELQGVITEYYEDRRRDDALISKALERAL